MRSKLLICSKDNWTTHFFERHPAEHALYSLEHCRTPDAWSLKQAALQLFIQPEYVNGFNELRNVSHSLSQPLSHAGSAPATRELQKSRLLSQSFKHSAVDSKVGCAQGTLGPKANIATQKRVNPRKAEDFI